MYNLISKTEEKNIILNTNNITKERGLILTDREINELIENKNEMLSILKELNIIEIMILKNNYIFNDYIDNILNIYIKILNKKEQFIINNNYMNLRIMK